MNQHLFNKVETIVKSRMRNGAIGHHYFDSINNRQTVFAALDKLNLKPNCPTNPTMWYLDDGTIAQKVSRSVAMPKYKRRQVSVADQCRDKLLAGELLIIDEQPICKKYVMQVVSAVRKQGYRVTSNFDDNRVIVSYQIKDKTIDSDAKIKKAKGGLISQLHDILLKKGFINISDFEGDKQYLFKLVWQMRKEGHEIDTIRQGAHVVRYELVK